MKTSGLVDGLREALDELASRIAVAFIHGSMARGVDQSDSDVDLVIDGWLVKHTTSPEEIRDLLGVADRDLKDCTVDSLSDDWRLAIAYNAALQCATAALAACGYRASRDAHH